LVFTRLTAVGLACSQGFLYVNSNSSLIASLVTTSNKPKKPQK
jgi:hypothetical protein